MAARINKPKRMKVRAKLLARQNNCCAACQCTFSTVVSSQDYPTFEHLIPQALGGTNEQSNLVLSCRRCNFSRGHLEFSKFKELPRDVDNKPGRRGVVCVSAA